MEPVPALVEDPGYVALKADIRRELHDLKAKIIVFSGEKKMNSRYRFWMYAGFLLLIISMISRGYSAVVSEISFWVGWIIVVASVLLDMIRKRQLK